MEHNFLEKIASEIDQAADYIESQEKKDESVRAEGEDKKKAEEETKRKEMMTPIKEKLSTMVDESEIDEKLKSASTDALELISKSLSKSADSKVEDDWGNVVEPPKFNKNDSRGKYAGYKDPIEAFAMGD
jgi:uncharacterized protein YwqG